MNAIPLRPSARFVGICAGLLPLWLLPMAAPVFTLVALGVTVLLFLAGLVDAVVSHARLRSLRLELPASVRGSRLTPFDLHVTLRGADHDLHSLVLAPMLPPEVDLKGDLPSLDRLRAGEAARFTLRLCGNTRGQFEQRDWLAEAQSILGLFHVRKHLPGAVTLGIHPAVKGDMRKLSHLLLSRNLMGAHHIRVLGKGREFEKLREYQPGDAAEDIHWKATARRGVPVTKTFQIERSQDIYAVIDHSRLAAVCDQAGEPVLDRFLAAATVLGMVLQRQNDRMGVVTFADHVTHFLQARAGLRHLTATLEILHRLQAREVSPDFAELATVIRTRIRRRAVLILLTDLRDPVAAERLTRHLRQLVRAHHVLVVSMQGGGIAPIFSGPAAQTEDDVYAGIEGHLAWNLAAETTIAIRATGAHIVFADSGRFAAELVDAYLKARKRQVL